MKEELKSCPFCGDNKVKYYNGWAFGDRELDEAIDREPTICCEKCGIGFISGSYGRGVSDEIVENDAIEHWNKRAGE